METTVPHLSWIASSLNPTPTNCYSDILKETTWKWYLLVNCYCGYFREICERLNDIELESETLPVLKGNVRKAVQENGDERSELGQVYGTFTPWIILKFVTAGDFSPLWHVCSCHLSNFMPSGACIT